MFLYFDLFNGLYCLYANVSQLQNLKTDTVILTRDK